MSGSANKVILVGNLGANPEIRRLNDGKPVASMRVATSEGWRDKTTGERKERTEWHSVIIFNENLADLAEKHIRKGAKVYVEGALQTRKWQDARTGADRYTTEIVLQRYRGILQILASPPNDDRQASRSQSQSYAAQSGSSGLSQSSSADDFMARDLNSEFSDEIPF